MKFIRKKIIKDKPYYYFEFPIKIGKKRKVFSKYLGSIVPENLKEQIPIFFNEIAVIADEYLGDKTKNYFQPKKTAKIEQSRFWYHSLHHELYEGDLNLFRSLFTSLFVLNSNRSEGSKVTRKDIEKILNRKQKPKSSIDLEVINSLNAMNFSFSNKMKWNLKSIKKIHSILLDKLAPEIAGKFKKVNNTVNNQLTTPWEKVSKELGLLLRWFKDNQKKSYPPILALEFHSRFERIHPFEDGNGRVGRILFNSYLLQLGYMPVVFFSDNHSAYCNALLQSQQGRKRKLAYYLIDQIEKTRKAVEKYKKEGIIRGGSSQVGHWEIEHGKIRKY